MSAALLTLLSSASEKLWYQARDREAAGEHEIAVIFAHAACDLHTEDAVTRLVTAATASPLRDFVLEELERSRSTSFEDDRLYRVYTKLTQDQPRQASWWNEWKGSRDVRNAVAHKGIAPTNTDAENALRLTREYMDHVTRKVNEALQLGEPPR